MVNYNVRTYEEAINVINELGILPLAPIIPEFPSLNTITLEKYWHSDTEFDPWIWRTKFSADGVAGYGKFIKKKSVLISLELLPYIKRILGHSETVEERYYNGNMTKEAFDIYKIISQEEGIDTRALRKKAGLKDSDKKRLFDNAMLELQGSMDIVISGIQDKVNEDGEKNGWSSTAFETYDSWAMRNSVENIIKDREEAKKFLISHFKYLCSNKSLKNLEKIFA